MGVQLREINETEFQQEVLDSSMPVIVDFTAEWCAPCKMIAPFVNDIATQYEGKVRIVLIDADQSQHLMQQYGVMGLPTLILFKNGEELERISGFKPKDKILGKLTPFLE